MHFYLSSYLLGDRLDYLKEQALKYPKIALIPNAMDIQGLDPERLKKSNQDTVNSLVELGFDVSVLDLSD